MGSLGNKYVIFDQNSKNMSPLGAKSIVKGLT